MKKLNRFIEIPVEDDDDVEGMGKVEVGSKDDELFKHELKLSVVATKPYPNKFQVLPSTKKKHPHSTKNADQGKKFQFQAFSPRAQANFSFGKPNIAVRGKKKAVSPNPDWVALNKKLDDKKFHRLAQTHRPSNTSTAAASHKKELNIKKELPKLSNISSLQQKAQKLDK